MKDFSPLTTIDKLTETLDKYGVAVLPNVLPEEECEAFKKTIFEHLATEFGVKEPDDYVKLNPKGEGRGQL